MIRLVRGLAWMALALLALPAHAQTFPPFSGLVVDAANILPADRKAALETKLQALQQQTKHQLVVATIPDLQGYPIEDYGYRLGRAWGVGLKDANNGAILIVAPNDRKVRVEVGYGLEPVLTDAFSSVIVQTRILPAFKAGDMPAGIAAGADALIAQLSLPDTEAKARVDAAAQEYDRTHRRRSADGGVPIGLIFWVAIAGVLIVSSIRRGRAGRRYRGRSRGSDAASDWPIWLWAASELARDHSRGGAWGGSGGSGDSGGGWGGFGGGSGGGGWGDGGFGGGGGGDFGGGGASGDW